MVLPVSHYLEFPVLSDDSNLRKLPVIRTKRAITMKSKFCKLAIVLSCLCCVTTIRAQQFYGAAPGYGSNQPVHPSAYYPGTVGSGNMPTVGMAPAQMPPMAMPASALIGAPPSPEYYGPSNVATVSCETGLCGDSGCATGCSDCGDSSCGGCGVGRGILGGGLFAGSGLFGSGDGICRPSRIWGGVEYLMWWHKERSLPHLVTTSPATGAAATAGVLGQTGTRTLFGNQAIGQDDEETGYRVTGGFWLDANQTVGIGGSYAELDTQVDNYSNASLGNPVLARPFFNLDPGVNAEDALLVAFPGVSEGGINAQSSLDVYSADVFLRYLLYSGYCNRIDVIAGYHRTEIEDDLLISHNITSVDGTTHGPVGAVINSYDRYTVDNSFDGGEIGLRSQANDGRLTWSLLTKISFGNMRQRVTIDGSTTTTLGAASATNNYGLLTLPSNIGAYERDEFSIVPELNVGVAYNLNSSLSASVGYSVIYWSDIYYAHQVIDTTINPTQVTGGLVGTNAPVFSWADSKSFWTQGLTFGLHGRF